MAGGHRSQRARRVVDGDDRNRDPLRHRGVRRDEEARGAGGDRVAEEGVRVVARPADRDEERAGRDRARVDRSAAERGGFRAAHELASGPRDDVGGGEGDRHACFPRRRSARRASSRSSNGSFSRPTIW